MRKFTFEEENILLDDGYFWGRGVFETILVDDKPVLFREHIQRLNNGIEKLKIGESVNQNLIFEKIQELNLKKCALKIIVTPKNIVMMKRTIQYTKDDYKQGFKIKISKVIRNSTSNLTYIKSINYIENIMENELCKKEGYNEVIFLNEHGYVTEGSTSNIFIVKNDILYTPEVKSGLLEGIVRNFIIKNSICIEKKISLEELLDADEVFITNSIIGVMSISAIEDKKIKNNIFTNNIKDKYEQLIR